MKANGDSPTRALAEGWDPPPSLLPQPVVPPTPPRGNSLFGLAEEGTSRKEAAPPMLRRSEEENNTPNDPIWAARLPLAPVQSHNVMFTQVGARLHHFWKCWETLGVKRSVVDILQNGLKWEFMEEPLLRRTPWTARLHMS